MARAKLICPKINKPMTRAAAVTSNRLSATLIFLLMTVRFGAMKEPNSLHRNPVESQQEALILVRFYAALTFHGKRDKA